MKKGKTFIVSGPSGVGKGSVLKVLLEKRKDVYVSVSATTRPPRAGEDFGLNPGALPPALRQGKRQAPLSFPGIDHFQDDLAASLTEAGGIIQPLLRSGSPLSAPGIQDHIPHVAGVHFLHIVAGGAISGGPIEPNHIQRPLGIAHPGEEGA